jgi:hypothetical protein
VSVDVAVGVGTPWEYASFVASSVSEGTKVISINGQVQSPDTAPGPFQVLNEMGAEGWELVSVHALIPPSPNAVTPRGVWEYVLKRQRLL